MTQTQRQTILVLMAQTGINQEREVQFSQQAASHSAADWGNTYAEVDFGAQHVYMYENGALIAGCSVRNRKRIQKATQPGRYLQPDLQQTDRVLLGAKKADGTYE
ncbi:MAG: hypothetical protein ACLR8P_03205 [Clostridium fessum]